MSDFINNMSSVATTAPDTPTASKNEKALALFNPDKDELFGVSGSDNCCIFGGSDAVSIINELMVQLAELFKKLRNMLQQYNVKQQELAFTQQTAAYDSKLGAIAKTYGASIATAITEIVTGTVGVIGAGVASGTGADLASHVTQAGGKGLEGIAKSIATGVTQEAQTIQAQADFQSTSAENYGRGVADVSEKARKASQELESVIRQLVELFARMTQAIQSH